MKNKRRLIFFSSLEEENRVEYMRRAKMSHSQRLKEFGQIQIRIWSKKWIQSPMIRKIQIERINW